MNTINKIIGFCVPMLIIALVGYIIAWYFDMNLRYWDIDIIGSFLFYALIGTFPTIAVVYLIEVVIYLFEEVKNYTAGKSE